jgi:hypothetical protein
MGLLFGQDCHAMGKLAHEIEHSQEDPCWHSGLRRGRPLVAAGLLMTAGLLGSQPGTQQARRPRECQRRRGGQQAHGVPLICRRQAALPHYLNQAAQQEGSVAVVAGSGNCRTQVGRGRRLCCCNGGGTR